MALMDIQVPDIGDFKDVAVIELLVKPGDTIQADQSLVTVESDKASMEIPSSHAGVVKELKVKVGDKLNQGDLLLVIEAQEASAASPSPSPAPAGEGVRAPRPPTPALPTSTATCSCSAAAPAVIRPPSARPTWA